MNERQKKSMIERAIDAHEKNKVWYAYILDSIHSDDVDVDKMSDKEKIEFAFKMFYEEKVKNDRRYLARIELLTEWLQGLCSTVSIAFADYDIEQIGKQWGCYDSNFVSNWFRNVATRMFALARVLGADIEKYL